MTNTYQLVVDASYKGSAAFRKAQADIERLNKEATGAAQKTAAGFKSVGVAAVAGGVAILGAAVAAKQLYGTLREGAALQTTAARFDKLSQSIGTTADAMLGKLKTATKGMISDMELMSSASGIISLRLADNEDQVIRLATVVGTLGWDMQQVILTFANLSKMRLDALGLSVEEVTTKQKELEAQGMSTAAAFKEAVILAGEARLAVGGVSEVERSLRQMETIAQNTGDTFKQVFAVQLTEATGIAVGNVKLVEQALKDTATTAATLTANVGSTAMFQFATDAAMKQLEALGGNIDAVKEKIKQAEAERGGANLFELGFDPKDAEIAAARYEIVLHALNMATRNATLENLDSWSIWADGVAANTAAAAEAAVLNAHAAFLALMELRRGLLADDPGDRGLGWAGVTSDSYQPSPLMPDNIARSNAAAGVLAQVRQADTLSQLGRQFTRTAEAAAGYGSSIGYVNEEEQRLAATHASMLSSFNAEAGAKLEDGLIGADGLVNMEAANKALYEQAQAAGATAGELALLGVATGALTEEQANAALKAAILMERIKQLAAGVTSGDLSIGDAMSGLGDFRAQLDSGAFAGAAGGIEGLASAAEEFANGSYQATLDVENAQANAMINETGELLGGVTGTHYINLVTTSNAPTGTPHNAIGGPVSRNTPHIVGEFGPELFVPSGNGSIMPNSQTEKLLTNYQGGATYNVTVTNYIDGQQAAKSSLDDITRDKMAAALRGLGLGGR